MKGYIGIKTPEPVTIEGLYALMQREGKFALAYELHGSGLTQAIHFPLKGNNVIQVAARKNSISVSTAKASQIKDIGLSAITDGWSAVLDRSKKDNQAMLESIAAEIRRLTGGK